MTCSRQKFSQPIWTKCWSGGSFPELYLAVLVVSPAHPYCLSLTPPPPSQNHPSKPLHHQPLCLPTWNFQEQVKPSIENESFKRATRQGLWLWGILKVEIGILRRREWSFQREKKNLKYSNYFSSSASGGGTEGGAILLCFCGSPDPWLMQQNEPFLP